MRSINASAIGLMIEILTICGVVVSAEIGSINCIIILSILAVAVFYFCLLMSRVDIISNLVYLFPGFGALYGLTYPFLKYVLGVLPTELRAADLQSMLRGSEFVGLTIMVYMSICLMSHKLYKDQETEYKVPYYSLISLKVNNILIDLAFALFYVVMLRLYMRVGGYSAVFSGDVTRRTLSDQYNTISTVYSYVKYMYAGYSVYVLYSFLNKNSRLSDGIINIIRLMLVLTFWGFDIALGNRRLVIYIMLAVILYYSNKSDFRFRLRYIIPVIIGVGLLIYIGVARNVSNTNVEISIRDAFGEFIYPMVTLYFYVGNSPHYLFGSSLFYFVFSFIPRSIWAGKPVSLALKFMTDYRTVMGYGYTPFTEMYVNFGVFGIIIGAVLLFLYFQFMTRNKKRYPILYLATYMQLLNFFRGEITSSLVEIAIIGITIKILSLINNSSVDVAERI